MTARFAAATRSAMALTRNLWRGLTSMRTALALLFLLALAAIPGALIPQRNLSEGNVEKYLAEHPGIGRWFDRLQLFEVFSSSWFTAIYVLLFVSLVGCIVPRCVEYAHALRAPLVATPRNLSRMPHHARVVVEDDPARVIETVTRALPRWRVQHWTAGEDGSHSISAEKGYLHEVGNLIFHIALVGLLATVALGRLFSYEGNRIFITDGSEICTASPSAYDSFRAGSLVDGTDLTPICLGVEAFKARYLPSGQADTFEADLKYQAGSDLIDNRWQAARIAVNHPLRIVGDRIYLQGHGFAPTFTVTYPNGESRTITTPWIPDGSSAFLSSGIARWDAPGGLYPDLAQRREHQIAVEGLFAPTAVLNGKLLGSGWPEMLNPAVAIDIYRGDAGLDSGKPQSVFALDQRLVKDGKLKKQGRKNLVVGEEFAFDDGTRLRFDGAKEFVNLQVSHDRLQPFVLISAALALLGLVVSLTIKRRRVWVRIACVDGRAVNVDFGGLARTDHAGWGSEFDVIVKRVSAGTNSVG